MCTAVTEQSLRSRRNPVRMSTIRRRLGQGVPGARANSRRFCRHDRGWVAPYYRLQRVSRDGCAGSGRLLRDDEYSNRAEHCENFALGQCHDHRGLLSPAWVAVAAPSIFRGKPIPSDLSVPSRAQAAAFRKSARPALSTSSPMSAILPADTRKARARLASALRAAAICGSRTMPA